MQNIFKLVILFFLLMCVKSTVAQESKETSIDTLTATVNKLQHVVEAMQRLKVTGYVQVQTQFADSAGIKSFAGGNFDPLNDKRFGVRRGRLKFIYTIKLASFVAQVDITEKGIVTKDMSMEIRDPWKQVLSLTGGIFYRPFGYEISQSSSIREAPERSRFTQILFPDELDLGYMLTFQMPINHPLHFLKIQSGYFAGNGIHPETDKKKDFIGRITLSKSAFNEKLKYGMGVSYYDGGVFQATPDVYVMNNGTFAKDASAVTVGRFAKRRYSGIDAQLAIETGFGITTLRGEYVKGKQSSSANSPASFTLAPSVDLYNRDVKGSYFYFIQEIKGTKHQFVVKYDMFDPNTKISSDQVGITTAGKKATTAGDLKYTTTGIGWIYNYDTSLKFMAYYDLVRNETSKNIAGYSKDLRDNVFTLRMQFKF